jgi:Kef-type K+ transport system membrane component KefB
VGVLIGPSVFGLIGGDSSIITEFFAKEFHLPTIEAREVAHETKNLILNVLAELGVIVLLFSVGLETNLRALLKLGGRAFTVAVAGVILPFMLGAGLTLSLSYRTEEALFIGAAMVATSVGITARVLSDIGKLQTSEARIILGAAVIDDVLGILVLSAVLAILGEGRSPLEIVGLIIVSFTFMVVVVAAGVLGVRRISVHFERLHIHNPAFTISLLLCLGLASAAAQIGLAAIIGAFLAGLVFGESVEQEQLAHAVRPIYELLVPIFFVVTGSKVELASFSNTSIIWLGALVTVLAIIGKFIGCGMAATGMGSRSMAIIGVGMAPRGEVGLIVATIGLSNNIFTEANGLYSVVVIMSIVTTLVVPPILTLLFRGYQSIELNPPPNDIAIVNEEAEIG